jgi:endonuclease/exonuclease/phosphatase family metal-dependent hydrolase
MRVWILLTAILFLTRCADQIRPYWKSIVGAQEPSGSAAQTTKPDFASRRGIRLASWNMEWLDTPGRGPKPRTRSDYARLSQYAERLKADVIAVQEVASELALALVFPPEQYGYHLAARGGSQRSGFVFKRSLPAIKHEDLTALAGEHLRAGADLGVRMGDRELRILSVHLKAFCATGPLDANDRDCRQLKAQLPVLEAWVDTRAREGDAFAVVGDFNRALSDREDELLRTLDDGDPEGLVLAQATPARRGACTKKSHQAVDHMLLGGPATSWLAPASFAELIHLPDDVSQHVRLSDHCPLVIELRLPNG